MAGPYFIAGHEREGFDGYQLFGLDDGTTAVVIAPVSSALVFQAANNNSYPQLIDNSAILHNRVAGAKIGDIRTQGPVGIDRKFEYLLTNAFGPRVSDVAKPALTPWLASFLPNAGGTVVTAGGIWFSDILLSAQFDVAGQGMEWNYQASAVCCDPDNVGASPNLTAPAVSGTVGFGISTLFDTIFGDGSAGVYDSIRSISIRATNNLAPIKAQNANSALAAARLIKGFTPGQFSGRVNIVQNKGATLAIPSAQGTYEFVATISDPSAAHTLMLSMSMSYDARVSSQMPNDQNTQSASYTLFGAAGSLSWPLTAAYA